MIRIVLRQFTYGGTGALVRISKGEVLFVRKMIPPGVEDFAEVSRRTGNGLTMLTFKVDVVATMYDANLNRKCAEHVLFVRDDRGAQGGALDFVRRPNRCPVVREALLRLGLPTVHALDGFSNNAVLFSDEFAALESGSRGWIVRKALLGQYMKMAFPSQGGAEVAAG